MKKIVLIILSLAILISCKAKQDPEIIYVNTTKTKINNPYGDLIAKNIYNESEQISIKYFQDYTHDPSMTMPNYHDNETGSLTCDFNIVIGGTYMLANWDVYATQWSSIDNTPSYSMKNKPISETGYAEVSIPETTDSSDAWFWWDRIPTKKVTYYLDFVSGVMFDYVNSKTYKLEKVN